MFKEEVIEVKALELPLWKIEGVMKKAKIRFVIPNDCNAYISISDVLIPVSSKDIFNDERFYKNKYTLYVINNKVNLNIKFGFNLGEIKYDNYDVMIKSGCHGQIDYEVKLNEVFVHKYHNITDVSQQIITDYRPLISHEIEMIFKKSLITDGSHYNKMIANSEKLKNECLNKINEILKKDGLYAKKMEFKIEETEDVKGYKEEIKKTRQELEIDNINAQKHQIKREDKQLDNVVEIEKIRAGLNNVVGHCPKCGRPHQGEMYCPTCGTKLKGDENDVL